MSRTLRFGLAAALLGLAAGVAVAMLRIRGLDDVFDMPPFSSPMLAPLGLGALAALLAVVEMMRADRYRVPAGVFALGVAAIASPFVIAIVLGVVAAAIAVGLILAMVANS